MIRRIFFLNTLGDILGCSAFQRLCASGITPYLLNLQYRMHPGISEWPSQHFYQGKMLNGVTEVDRPPIPGILVVLNIVN